MDRELRNAIQNLDHTDVDTAAVELAHNYAQRIDADPDSLKTFGPLLLAVLESLGMTPRARARLTAKEGGSDQPASDPLGELQRRRDARRRDAEDLDTTAS